MPGFNILDYGARGDGQHNDASAIQATIDACAAAGGGRVLVPAGRRFLTGTIALRSHVELHLEHGALLLGSANPDDYTTRLPVSALDNGRQDVDQPGLGMLITADRAENVAITGGGTIDGNGRSFIAEPGQYIHVMQPWRPFTLFLLGCQSITIRDITIRDGALWTLRLSGCQDVLIDGVRIANDLRLPNSDGIDLDRCRNVRVVGCHVVAGDDAICLKTCPETAQWGDACENIVVTGCTLMSTSAALIVGCEARSVMRNIVFDSCVVESSHRGLAIHLSEAADVENVLFSNMIVETRLFHERWWGRAEPIYVVALPWTAQHQVGRIRRVRFSNVLCRSESGALIYGFQPGQITDVTLDNVRLELDKWSRWPGGRLDLRPCPGEQMPERPTDALTIHHATDVVLRNVDVVWGQHRPPYFGRALRAETAENLTLDNFRGLDAHAEPMPDA